MKLRSNNKRIAKNTFFLYLRMLLTMAVSLYTVRVVLQTLSAQDYGIYGAVGGIILSFGFISGVLANASQRFFAFEIARGDNRRLRETFSTMFFTYVIISLLIVLFAETIGLWFLQNKMTIPLDRGDSALWVFQFALLSFVITILSNPFQAIIISHEKMGLYAYLSIIDVVLKLLVVYALILIDVDKLKLYSVLMFCSSLIVNSIYVYYCRKKYIETRIVFNVDKKILKSIFSYSSWTLLGTTAGMCNTQGMNILLNVFFGPLANAAYSVSSQVYHAVAMFANNFYLAVKPPLIKNYSAGNFQYVNKLFIFSSKAIYMLLFVVTLPILINTKEILLLWLGDVSEYMVCFVQLSLIYTVILTISYPITAVVQASGKVKMYHSVVDGFSLISLPLMYILFKLGYDAYYSYVISIAIFFIAHLLRILILKRVLNLFIIKHYLLRVFVPMIIISIIAYFIMFNIKTYFSNTTIDLLLISGIASIIALLLGLFILLSKTERTLIISLITNKKL